MELRRKWSSAIAKTKTTRNKNMKITIPPISTSIGRSRKYLRAELISIAIGLVWLTLSHEAQAVVPAPDGGYPGGNTAEGQQALLSLTTGTYNTAVGLFSLRSTTDGQFNTAIGAGALLGNTADQNTATGVGALLSNTTGSQQIANGAFALFSNTDGTSNTAIGNVALFNNTTGSFNVALGAGAGVNATTGSRNVYLGTGMEGVFGESNTCYIASIFGQTSANGIPVLVNSDNKLGTTTSSKRFKEEIKPMAKASEALLALKPVRFRYKKEIDPAGTSQFGLVAEEVEKVNPALVVRDKEGKPYSVRYDQVNAMLLNEFLKEHRKVEEQQTTIGKLESTVAQQQKGMEAVTARLDQQAAQIQKVSAQIELSGPAPQMVLSNR
jgi:trimeric autotransporter adhesin